MITYISILRGINVSGQRLIKMDSLQKMYEKLGFQCMKTYIQSGNVIFKHKDCKTEELEEIINKQYRKGLWIYCTCNCADHRQTQNNN